MTVGLIAREADIELNETELSGKKFYGTADTVHINVGKIRASLSMAQFLDAEHTYLRGVAIKRTVVRHKREGFEGMVSELLI